MIKTSMLAVLALSSALGMASSAFADCGPGLVSGTVKFFNTEKGFGTIRSDGNVDYHVHVSGLKDDIQENDKVCFTVEPGRRGGLNAVNVRLKN